MFADVTNGMTIARREIFAPKTSCAPKALNIVTFHGAVYGCLTLPWGESAGSSLTVVRRQQ
jgi:hypothetical protein